MTTIFQHDTHANEAANEIFSLLTQCQQLQSEKDGRERAVPGTYSHDEDEFADRIRAARGNATLLRQLMPMLSIGAEMERRGEITVISGESYADRAQGYLMIKYLAENGDTP